MQAMQVQAPSPPAPAVRIQDLPLHMHKSVCVAGRLVDSSAGTTMRIADDSGAAVDVTRPADAPLVLEPGMVLLVRGTVNQDLSICEAPDFPTTDLGDSFDLALFQASCPVLNNSAFAHIFAA
jgi:hypothetical protein